MPSALVTVERLGDVSRPLVCAVKVLGGTADAGSDYDKARLDRSIVRFAAGQAIAILRLPTLPTREQQPRETLRIRINQVGSYQPLTVCTVVFQATPIPQSPRSAVAVSRLANQFRAVETFSNPENPGQIVAQLRANQYPDPTAKNRIGEVSGTNGLAAYPGDGRNTPGAFQVDLANIGIKDPYNPWIETFGEWKGTPGSQKGASPFDTQIALSKSTLSEFFGIEVDANGLITKIGAPAASVFMHSEALALANENAWSPTANPLIGQHIDNFQSEQLSLMLAGRAATDSTTGVTDPRTAPEPVMDLAQALQVQVGKSFLYSVYQKYAKHDAYKAMFAEAQKLFGATLKIKASTAAFGVTAGQEFWTRINGSFVVAGAYVSGEVAMANLLTAFVQASKTGSGTWVIDPGDPSKNVTFTRVTPAGTPAQQAIFSVNRTPLNVSPNYPSIFHYGAVVSPLDEGVSWNDPAAFNVKGRNIDHGLGYTRLPAAQAVTGTTTINHAGRYTYSGLAASQTLTLVGAGPFFIVGQPSSGGLTITSAGYPLGPNNNQTVTTGQKINIGSFGLTTPQAIFDASFYGWYGAGGILQMKKVNDPAVPSSVPLYLYFVPAAGGNPANVLAHQNDFYNSSSPYYHSARIAAASVNVLGRAPSTSAWAGNFLVTPPAPGSGVIDASQATGPVFIVVDDSVATVKLGTGRTVVIGLPGTTAAKTYVLNSQPLVGSGARPFLAIKAGDKIDARGVTGHPAWTINNAEQATSDNRSAASSPYRRYSAFSRYFATNSSQAVAAEFAAMLQSNDPLVDPAAIVRAALLT